MKRQEPPTEDHDTRADVGAVPQEPRERFVEFRKTKKEVKSNDTTGWVCAMTIG